MKKSRRGVSLISKNVFCNVPRLNWIRYTVVMAGNKQFYLSDFGVSPMNPRMAGRTTKSNINAKIMTALANTPK